jgi:DNA-binding FadR family transcriptional regulator
VRRLNFDALLDILSYSLLCDPSSLKDLYQVRKLFETAMIAEVVENIHQEDIQACRKLLKTWEANIASGHPYDEQDRLFHVTLCRSLGNKLLVELENIFWTAYRHAEERMPALRDLQVDPMNMEGGLKAHIDLLSAVEARDAEIAQRLMAEHFEGIRKRLEIVLKDGQPAQEEG